jgi:8-oxo-dGTP pyrophosphatase MutT (NUDIX family)
MKRKVLFKSTHLNVVELDGWFYATEPANSEDNLAVAVLPWRIHKGAKEFLARFELNPAHLLCTGHIKCTDTPHQVSIITGACETGDALYHAQHELIEEAGYYIDKSRFESCGVVSPIKSSCTKLCLYTVRIKRTDTQLDYRGDGLGNESREFAEWVDRSVMIKAKDPYIHTIMLRAGL